MPVAFGLWVMYVSRGDFDRADRLVRAMQHVASGEGDPIGLQTAHAAWTTSLFAGRLDDAEHRIRLALATYRTVDHHPTTFTYGNHDPGVCAGSLGSLTAALRGQGVLAHQRTSEAQRLADDLGHAVSAAQASAFGVWTAAISGGAGAVERLQTVPDVASTAPLWNLLEQGIRAWAAYVRDRDAAALQSLEGAMRSQLEMANDTFAAVLGSLLADVLIDRGTPAEAGEVLTLIEKHAEPMGGFVYDAEIARMRGRWHQARGDVFAAQNEYARAADLAEAQGALVLADRARRHMERSPF